MPLRPYADALERLYGRYNRRQYVHPDPLEFLFAYNDPGDREFVAVVASALAYGNVAQILGSVGRLLGRLGPRPARFVNDAPAPALRRMLADFRHRFAAGEHVAALLYGLGRLLRRHGSLEVAFARHVRPGQATVLPALRGFVEDLSTAARGRCGHLLPDPAKGSACKRLNLMLRWLVRCDHVDPGGWRVVPAAALVVPLDTHMHRIALAMGATRRKAADLRTALDVTEAFRAVRPDDPVRYDFALTRLGIRRDAGPLDSFRPAAAPRMGQR